MKQISDFIDSAIVIYALFADLSLQFTSNIHKSSNTLRRNLCETNERTATSDTIKNYSHFEFALVCCAIKKKRNSYR